MRSIPTNDERTEMQLARNQTHQQQHQQGQEPALEAACNASGMSDELLTELVTLTLRRRGVKHQASDAEAVVRALRQWQVI